MTKKQITAEEIMERSVVALLESTTLTEAWITLVEHRISGAPVVNDGGELVGVISQADLLRVAIEEDVEDLPRGSYHLNAPFFEFDDGAQFSDKLGAVTVDQVMTDSVITASPRDTIASLAVLMRRNHIHRLIITEGKKVAGIVSALDLLGVLEDH